MMTTTNYIVGLQQAADKARSVEAAYRQEASARIATLERERAFAFRRMNLMRSIIEAAMTQAEESSDALERNSEEIAVARALALLRVRLGWSTDSEMRDVTLAEFTPVAIALYRASSGEDQNRPDAISDIGAVLGSFEDWYEKSWGASFWTLFDNPMADTPRVDF